MSSQNKLYNSAEARADTAFDVSAELYRITNCLKKSKNYWTTEIYQEPSPMTAYNKEFYAWLEKEYGLELEFNGNNGMKGICGHKIVDEQKFLMFMIKFQ